MSIFTKFMNALQAYGDGAPAKEAQPAGGVGTSPETSLVPSVAPWDNKLEGPKSGTGLVFGFLNSLFRF